MAVTYPSKSDFRDLLVRRGITDQRLLNALARIPRELFVPPEVRQRAYEDRALPLSSGQTISQPYVVAWMTQRLELTGDEVVLEIGTGSGYQTAVLAELAREVITIERIPELADSARRRLLNLGYQNIEFHTGDGTKGWPLRAPYAAILVAAGTGEVPPALLEQLDVGGGLIIPVGPPAQQSMRLIRRTEIDYDVQDLGGCVFVPLVPSEMS
jgi:protein-L-isoaspartate(D-aspartate) O-methyltransferase